MMDFDYTEERERLLQGFIPPKKRPWWGFDPVEVLTKDPSDKNIETIRQYALDDFFFFSDFIVRDPNYPHLHIGLHDELCWNLQYAGDLLNLMPRNHLKSTNGAVAFPLWTLVRNPNTRIVIFADNLKVSKPFLSAIKQHIRFNPRLNLIFPELQPQPAEGNAAYACWTNTEITVCRNKIVPEPSIIASSYGQNIVGMHFDLQIYEDIVTDQNASGANLDDKLQAINDWFEQTLSLADRGCRLILNGTRRNDGDVYGKIIEEHDKNHIAVYRRQVVEDGKWIWDTPLNIAYCERQKSRLSAYEFACQYMNDPVVKGEEQFAPEWIRNNQYNAQTLRDRYRITCEKDEDVIKEFAKRLNLFLFLDPARSLNRRSDNSALLVAGKDENGELWAVAKRTGKYSDVAIADNFCDLLEEWKPVRAWIESMGGDSLLLGPIERAAKARGLGYLAGRIGKCPPRKYGIDNGDLIKATTKPFHDGKIHIPDSGDWADMEQEFLRFPYAKHDDQAVTIATIWQHGWEAGKKRKEDGTTDRRRVRNMTQMPYSWKAR